ncbi:hypothetical protein AYI92_12515 [Shewanella xiamenensis]|uniref:DUF2314 domain-containing protein n=1 Tax=Shewanella xiamenensis TaxID=332186 RepID=UPI0011867E11|nr:DUF2314 domain-containing protein [Shewanella xiamenensis]TVL18219.1 hypothetical protein AYI90_12660 [Shewanella xiamenensis]TVL18557.1 hypothetical protein AYI91_12275 [Shewanella xiamenensis]TVL25457.1 hypothetical protein AYI92_12515 [Shewanella xiamenensis]TVL31599.1 hypothetical protein AYI93_13115 [Shewanella xiamenensis]TVP01133.1 hypothetical protein AYI89_12455 [Shewanella xiamenensis]
MEDKFARIEIDGWELNDGETIHHQHSDTFWIPSFEARSNLKTGQLVKLIFQIITEDDAGVEEVNVERMWVIVKDRINNIYRGQLDNDPYCTEEIRSGMEVWFQPKHIIDIYE